MKYQRANEILPKEVLEVLQRYAAGQYLYIPRRENEKVAWGENTGYRKTLSDRNRQIKNEYSNGKRVETGRGILPISKEYLSHLT